MSFPRYPKYKDSDVEWLGEVPEHWEVKRLRYVSNIRKGRLPSVTFPSPTADTDLPYLSMEFLRGESDNPNYVPDAPNLLRAESGDLLLLWDGSNAGEFLRAKQGVVSSTVALIEARNIEKEFLFFACKARERQLKDQTVGMGIPHVSGDELRSFSIPCPAPAEQIVIAEFLDVETAKIDELVAEQRRLMELLKEKRQAVISHAVTRGLNPAAPLKPSGIEWLGDVPAHWTTTPIKYVANVGNGSTPSREVPEYWAETGFPWLNSSVVNSSVVTEPEGYVTERALRECHLPIVVPPAILVGITGQGRTRGMAAMLGIEATINQHVAYVRPSTAGVDVNYLLRIFESAYLKLRRDSEEAGATKGAITCEQIGNLRVPFPPLPEQTAIVTFLDAETAKFDTLTAEAQRAIDLLQERRTALISAAVTGQIDVRGSVALAPTKRVASISE